MWLDNVHLQDEVISVPDIINVIEWPVQPFSDDMTHIFYGSVAVMSHKCRLGPCDPTHIALQHYLSPNLKFTTCDHYLVHWQFMLSDTILYTLKTTIVI